jgi:hypothetical protein
MRAVDPDYVAQAGEAIFPDYATQAQLAAAFPGYVPPTPPRPSVLKSVVMDRVSAAGKMSSAYTMMTQNPDNFGKWFAPDKPFVYCDDPDAVAVVKALGLDPTVILAPA